MYFRTALFSSFLALSGISNAQVSVNTTGLYVHPVLTHAFDAYVYLGKIVTPISASPQEGTLSVLPIIGGQIFGPALNGTIGNGGLATPIFSMNNTVDNQAVQLYGFTNDTVPVPFYVNCASIGQPTEKFARCIISIGGKYSYLANDFVLAAFTDNGDITETTVKAWTLSRGPQGHHGH